VHPSDSERSGKKWIKWNWFPSIVGDTRAGAERDGQYLVIQGARELQARQEVDNWLKTIGLLK
jgi:hypothetical protein